MMFKITISLQLLVATLIFNSCSSPVPNKPQTAKNAFSITKKYVSKIQSLMNLDSIGEVESFGKKDLYKFIDGAADLYLSYGFKEAASGEFEFRGMKGKSFTIDIFDMGTSEGAVKIFKKENGFQVKSSFLGKNSATTENTIIFCQDSFYVKITLFESDSVLIKKLKELAKRLDDILSQ